jgi:TctA family transporter
MLGKLDPNVTYDPTYSRKKGSIQQTGGSSNGYQWFNSSVNKSNSVYSSSKLLAIGNTATGPQSNDADQLNIKTILSASIIIVLFLAVSLLIAKNLFYKRRALLDEPG